MHPDRGMKSLTEATASVRNQELPGRCTVIKIEIT